MRGLRFSIGIGLCVALMLLAVVALQPSPVLVGVQDELVPALMALPHVDVSVPERPAWEQSVLNCRYDFNYASGTFERRLCSTSERFDYDLIFGPQPGLECNRFIFLGGGGFAPGLADYRA